MRELALPAVFLDRDGTINAKAPEGEYVTGPERVRLLPGAASAIRRCNELGALVIVVTNQRGISRGRMSEEDLEAVHARLAALIAQQAGGRVDAFLHCPHDEGECDCRKPRPGLLRQALRRFPEIDLSRSVLIGDAPSDVEAGRRLGVATLQLGVDAVSLAAAVERAIAERTVAAAPPPTAPPPTTPAGA